MEMVVLFLQEVAQLQESSDMKLKLLKLESIYLFLFLFQCLVLQVEKDLSVETSISMEKQDLNSILK